MADRVLVGNIPMLLNLGDIHNWRSHIGHATVSHDEETGCSKIEITLDKEASEKLGDMVDVFDLRAIGFAGMKRPPQDRGAPDGR